MKIKAARLPLFRTATIGVFTLGCAGFFGYLLVQAGAAGMAAGDVADALGIPPNTLSFHLDRLRSAGLVTVRRESRSMIYAAHYDTMNALIGYLTENCCGGAQSCAPASACTPAPRRAKTPA